MDIIQFVSFFVSILALIYLLTGRTKTYDLDRNQMRYPSNLQEDDVPPLHSVQKEIALTKHHRSLNVPKKTHSNQFSEYELRGKKKKKISTFVDKDLHSHNEKNISGAISKSAVIVKRLHDRRDLIIYQEIMNPPKSMRENA